MDYIKSYDIHLGSFVLVYSDILKDKYAKLNEIKDNYDNYVLTNTRDIIDKFNTKLHDYLVSNNIKMTYKIDIIKLEEVKRLGLLDEFYGGDIDNIDFISNNHILDFETEKVRLFIRTELQNLFKNKTRKLEMKINDNDDN